MVGRFRRSVAVLGGGLIVAVVASMVMGPGRAGAETPAPHRDTSASGARAEVSAGTLPGVGDFVDAKHASLGGAAGVLGPAVDVQLCVGSDYCVQPFERGWIYWFSDTGIAAAFTDTALHEAWGRAGGGVGVPVPGEVGRPVTDTFCGLRDGGCGQHFQAGSIYRSAATGPVRVSTAVRNAWAAEGWERGALGYPVAAAFCGLPDGGCGQHFQGGSVYQSPATGTRVVHGPIRAHWAAQGWERSALRYPTTSTFCGLRDGGCGQHFQGASVYWSPATGTHTVAPEVVGRWAAQGWEAGRLGYPTSAPFTWGHRYRGQHFSGGSLYAVTADEVRLVLAPIRDRWGAQGWEHGRLGRPITDTFCGLRDGGCGQHFSGGSIYSSWAGTFTVHDSIAGVWGRQGWENGSLGFPTSDTFCGLRDGGCGQHFQGGSVYTAGAWWGARGFVLSGPFRDAWAARGWENGPLGYPTSDAYMASGGLVQNFQRGILRMRNGRVY